MLSGDKLTWDLAGKSLDQVNLQATLRALVASKSADLIVIDAGFSLNGFWDHPQPRVEWVMCPVSISELPSEILEHILLSLYTAEILKMKEVLLTTWLIPPFID